ncbi:MAG: hypothetical protein QXN95_04935 [Candidatus Bathyarchaeia archaeon]
MPMLIQKAECIATVRVYGYTDKPQYMPGETVTLKIWVYNEGPDEIVLKNVTIYLPWYQPVWGGDYIIDANNYALPKDQSWNTTITFEIPADSRAYTPKNIRVKVVYGIGSIIYTPERDIGGLSVILPSYTSLENMGSLLENMDKLLTLITVQVVLMIVCTIIIAAIIFFSTRRPKAIWVEEEEKEKSE